MADITNRSPACTRDGRGAEKLHPLSSATMASFTSHHSWAISPSTHGISSSKCLPYRSITQRTITRGGRDRRKNWNPKTKEHEVMGRASLGLDPRGWKFSQSLSPFLFLSLSLFLNLSQSLLSSLSLYLFFFILETLTARVVGYVNGDWHSNTSSIFISRKLNSPWEKNSLPLFRENHPHLAFSCTKVKQRVFRMKKLKAKMI